MCGIVGFLAPRQFDGLVSALPDAIGRLAHRGPDDTGIHTDPSVGLGIGHRRLSILDLSNAGRQPMSSNDGSIWTIYNGEIYNFQSIRSDLEQEGVSFRSRSDTEVLLEAYLRWGMECVHRFIGMFAFAIWDGRENRLHLFRDRMGIKPLFYYKKDDLLIFASELKAIMAFPLFPGRVDETALAQYLHYQYVPAPRSIFQDTAKVLPGEMVTFDGTRLVKRQYWTPATAGETVPGAVMENSEREWTDRLDDLLRKAVSDRLVSDVPFGALLSGGIDSSLVTAIMQQVNHTGRTKTYSIGFHESGYNEAPWAKRIARHLGTDHTELYLSADDALRTVPMLPEIYDEPFGDSSAIPTYLVSQLVRSQVTVALSGDGGDELFGGYVRYWMTQSAAQFLHHIPQSLRRTCSGLLGRLSPEWLEPFYLQVKERLPQRFQVANFQDKWEKLTGLMGASDLLALYRATTAVWSVEGVRGLTGGQVAACRYEAAYAESAHRLPMERLMLMDQYTYLPDAMLTKVDRASMAHGLEVRVPLLDHRIVALANQMPLMLKYRHGTGKYLLRKLLSRYLPAGLFIRPKMGFGVPIAAWLRNELRPLLLDYLSPQRLRREGRFDAPQVTSAVQAHLSGERNLQHQLWSLLMWEMWRERWLKGGS